MAYPRVERLFYRIIAAPGIELKGLQHAKWTLSGWVYSLDYPLLIVEPLTDYATIEDARAVLDPALTSWEIAVGIALSRPALNFQYLTADIQEETAPEEGEKQTLLRARSIGSSFASGQLTVISQLNSLPVPPTSFTATPHVQKMWNRWSGYNQNREPLTSVAYYCLTCVETLAGGRRSAATEFNVSHNVLDNLGRLVSSVGNHTTARKANVEEGRSHSPTEVRWIEKVTLALIQRVGERAANRAGQPPKITMANFPQL